MMFKNDTNYNYVVNNEQNGILLLGVSVILISSVCKCGQICFNGCIGVYNDYDRKRKRKKIVTLADDLVPTSSAICCICLDDFSDTEKKINKLRCGHIFHKNCVQEWLIDNETCPECRCKI